MFPVYETPDIKAKKVKLAQDVLELRNRHVCNAELVNELYKMGWSGFEYIFTQTSSFLSFIGIDDCDYKGIRWKR